MKISEANDIEDHVDILIQWLNNELSKNEIHPVIIGAIFHHRLVQIHPYNDANGRLARIISSLIFLQYSIPPPVVTEEDRSNYIFSLRNADTGDLTPFVNFIGKRILLSFDILSSQNTSRNE